MGFHRFNALNIRYELRVCEYLLCNYVYKIPHISLFCLEHIVQFLWLGYHGRLTS